MIEKNIGYSQSETPQKTGNFRLVEIGDRWHCIRCGNCCQSDFEEHWLDFIFKNVKDKGLDPIEGECPNLEFEEDKYTCSIYSTRPNACRGFPFTLRKQNNCNYKLVIHSKCPGFGKGRIIDIKQKFKKCLKYSNKEFHRKMQFDFTNFETDKSVILVK